MEQSIMDEIASEEWKLAIKVATAEANAVADIDNDNAFDPDSGEDEDDDDAEDAEDRCPRPAPRKSRAPHKLLMKWDEGAVSKEEEEMIEIIKSSIKSRKS